jgi:asparagine synthetase A
MRPKDQDLVIVESVRMDIDDEFRKQITVTLTMSEVLVEDFLEYNPPDMENDIAKEFGSALLRKIGVLIKNNAGLV